MTAPNILIVVSEFNRLVTESLLAGAQETLYKAGLPPEAVSVVWVPGAFELPLFAAHGARHKRFSAVICLGCVIRGETPHFDYVCSEAARGIMQVGLETGKPVIFGVLTTDTSAQALARAKPLTEIPAAAASDAGPVKRPVENKGVDAAEAALSMLAALDSWRQTFV